MASVACVAEISKGSKEIPNFKSGFEQRTAGTEFRQGPARTPAHLNKGRDKRELVLLLPSTLALLTTTMRIRKTVKPTVRATDLRKR